MLVTELAPAAAGKGLPKAELAGFGEQAAQDLLAVQPAIQHSSYEAGRAALFVQGSGGPASPPCGPLPHFRRDAELARAQGSDFWLARCARVQGAGARGV